jgi:hypothetical protein
MPYTVALPDGRTVEFPDSVSREEAAAIIRRQLGVGAQPKESTIGSELVRGAKQLASTTRTGIGALATPEESARAGVERSQQIAAEAGEGPSFAALRKAYEERGLLPAAGELLSQIPRAVAGQGAQLAAMAGGAKLGAMAGTAVAPGVGTIAGGILGAGATLLPQFFGANVERQAAEQMGRGEPVKIDRGTAAAAAAGQAGIEAAGTALVLGKRVVKGLLGVTDDAALATAKARADLVKAAERSRLGAAGRGAAVGVAEIPVEIAQAVIERAQAGLDVLSPEALSEYGENAYLAGLVGPTIGAATRVTEPGAARKKLAAEEQAKAAEERAAAAKAEAEKKKSPEYLLGLDTRYKEADAERVRREAEVAQRPKKGADPAQWIAYNQKVAELKEFKKANTPLNNEYTARKADIDAVNQQRAAEVEAAAAQEIPQEAQKLPYYASAQETIPGLEPVEAAPAAAEETVDYAKQARDLKEYLVDLQTQAKTTTDLDAKLKLSTDYARAEAALKEATRLTKASGQEEGKAIDKLRKQMAVAEDQGDLEAQGRIAQQLKDLGVTDLGAQAELDLGKPQALKKLQVPTDMADYQAAQQRAAEEKAAREAQQRQQQQLAREAYERSQQTAGMYTDVLAAAQRRAADRAAAEAETKAETERTQREEELVGKLVESTGAVQPQPVPQARMALPARETTESLYDQAAELRAQLTFAQQTRNKNLESRVRQQLQQIGASPEEKGSALDLGATAREAGVEGELTPEAMEQNRLMRLGQRQLMSYDQLVQFITQAREREQAAVDEKTKAQYKYRAEQLKQAAIGFALQEINGRRRQYGLAPLEQKEAMRAVTGLARPLNELVARGAQIFEEPVVVRGQQRGIRLVEGAQEFERPPAGKRTFSEAGFPAAADTLREQFRQVVETVSGKPQAAPPAPYAKPPGPVRKVVPEQRELFLTPPPAEEPVSLAPEGFFAKGIDKAASADDAQLLRQMQDVYTTLTPQQQSVVREQAQRAADGKPLDAVYEMRGLYQLRQREAATAAGQQTFLKPITLVTARRKIERLAQKAATLEKDLREKLEALLRTGVTRGIPELDAQLKAAKLQAAAKAPAKTTAEQAQAALDRALKQNKPVVDAAQQVKAEQFQQIAKFSSNIYTPLLERQKQLNAEWDAAVGEFSDIQLQYDFYRAEFDAGRAPKTNRAELEALTRLIPGTADRVVEVSKRLDAVNQMVTAAENVIARVREKQAADTVVGPLLKEAAKAEAKIKTAQQKLAVAKEVERSAERAHKKALENVPKEPTLLSQIEALPITGAVRVFRDTSDPAVQSQATKKRSAIAREEGTYAVLEERIKDAQGDERVKLQKQLNESEERLQKLHDELYDVYGNAPLKRVEGKTVEAAASAERLEKARHEVHSAEIDAFNAKHDTARLSLPARKAGPIISEKGVVKQGGERVIKAEPATPIADIAATRKRIDEINQQFAYIKENPAKSAEGKAKQAKVKTQLAAERQTLGAKLKELLQAQRQVSQEEKAVERELKGARTVSKRAIKQTKLEATDAQLFEDLADAKLSKEQRQLFERAQNAFGAMSAPEQAFVRRQANALVGRREADYKAEALAAVVQTAERRMAREGDIEFSRGPTESPSTTASVRTELSKAFPDLGRVQIYDSVDALVAANPQYEGRIPSDARGFVDTAGNKAFLIAENINKGDALAVLLHEVGAHIGLKNMLGTTQYNALVKAVETWAKKNDGSVESRVAKAAQASVEAAKTPANQKADETLAYAIEEAVKAGVKPMETKGVLGQWLSQIATLFRKALEKFGLPAKSLDAQGLVDMAFGAAKMEMQGQAAPETGAEPGEILFSRNLPTASRVANQIIGKQPTVLDSIKKNLFGLSFRTQVIDALAPLEQIAYTSMDPLKGAQMMYYLRKYGMRNNMTQEAIENGVAQVQEITRPDGQKERIIEAVQGANIKDIVKRLAAKDVIKEAGSADAANRLFTLYMSAIRGENKGFDKLNFGRAAALSELQKIERELASPRLEPQEKTQLNARKAYLEKNLDSMPTEADFRAAKAEIDANPTLKKAFDEAREMYNEYNTDLLNFLVQTGAISKDEAARLLRAKDYIPYYRMRGGNAELMIGGETPIRIGNLKDSPHLQELVGGEEPIFDFLTSSVQNTSMLLDMGLRNIAAKNVAYELADAGLASKPARAGKTGAPKGTLEFKLDGEDYFVRVDTDYIGVPSDLLVKGMAGIPTMLPQGLRLMGIPAQILRRAVTSTPVFAAKQLFRDSLGAYMLSGSDAPPLLSAVNQLRKASPLKARGVTGGQTFTGTTEDISRLLKEMQEGRPGWMKAFTKMEAMAHKADAATRQSQYESYRAQGLSDMEAELMALESMNFSKRGLSPTMHMASMLVPFLNAQIQGLDVLYKALTGNMPFNDKLDIQRKLFTRGASMFALTMAYAAAMQDDEEYKNAPPDVKYGNWFVRLPFLDEMAGEKVTLRVPIPFEVGYIFKALPEMLYNSMKSDRGAKEAFEALNHILIQIVPGGSSMVPIEIGGAKIPVPVPIPAAMKPVIEVGLGKSFFTGRDLESAREQQEVPGMRYRERTSEIAKYIGESVNFSPIRIEALVNGYTGGLGLLALQALSLPLPKADVVVPEKRWSELPLVGPMFQPADASNIIDGVYKDFQKVTQAKTTYDNLIVKGETGKAQAFLQENLQLIMMNQMAGEYRQMMGELTKNERIIRGSKLTEEEKRKLVDQIKAAKIQIAASVRAVLERKAPQAALA